MQEKMQKTTVFARDGRAFLRRVKDRLKGGSDPFSPLIVLPDILLDRAGRRL